jgi:hypothetical protein
LLAGALLGTSARAETDLTEHLNAERDALIDKITKGVDYDASVKRFTALVKERDAIVATSFAAKEKERLDREKERAERDARHQLREEFRKSADGEVAWRCTLQVDPVHPVPSHEGRMRPDWGKITRKETVRLPPKNELDEGELATMYEMAGTTGPIQFRGEHVKLFGKPFEGKVGDLVLLCQSGQESARNVPPGWGPRVAEGFAANLKEPPHIAKKARWNPIHVTGTAFFWAIKDVKWKFPPGAFVLSNIEIDKDLGGGQYEIDAEQHLSWILEVPPNVKGKELLQPGHHVWAILGNPRFDRGLKKLVLVAEDLEAKYIVEK